MPGPARFYSRPITESETAIMGGGAAPPDDIVALWGAAPDEIDSSGGLRITVLDGPETFSGEPVPRGAVSEAERQAVLDSFATATVEAAAVAFGEPAFGAGGPPEAAFNLPADETPDPIDPNEDGGLPFEEPEPDDPATIPSMISPAQMKMSIDEMRRRMRTPTFMYKTDEKRVLCATCKHCWEGYAVAPVQSTTDLFFVRFRRCLAYKRRMLDLGDLPIYACSAYREGRALLTPPPELAAKLARQGR